ncbi:hypothetical protein JQ760_028505 (plasmid) [Klebsiella pneumoniae]|uniref:hypothetical protein n=1 Tax=Klebsiella pneumoniae TaxID=573 RepID=UPI001FACE91A|nr:hypothetical protein [Klebsiella pneumoniae]MCI8108395.1 hypothetical protein [Klebsiella pneumoniae]
MEKYLELDKRIMDKIGDNPVPFAFLFVRDSDIANECEKIAREEGKEPFRVLDRRLQALRKAGSIRSTTKGWVRI